MPVSVPLVLLNDCADRTVTLAAANKRGGVPHSLTQMLARPDLPDLTISSLLPPSDEGVPDLRQLVVVVLVALDVDREHCAFPFSLELGKLELVLSEEADIVRQLHALPPGLQLFRALERPRLDGGERARCDALLRVG